MANIKDFAVGLVSTAPSPKNSGTTLTLRPGEGATMPNPPFYVTATPPGQLTSIGTSEKLLVTNVSGDTLTITRAQSPTTAKSIDVNWTVANAMYVDDVYQSNIVVDEKLTGTINGTNKVFTTASAFTSIQVYKNGVAMHKTDDFTVTGYNQITFVTAPASGSNLIATYITGSQVMINGSNSLAFDETPTGTVNGSNAVFTTAKPYTAGSLQVFINGIKQKSTTHFTETSPSAGTFTMGDAPLTGDDIMVNYQYVQSVSGNADTVDGYHANATPTANNIPVLDSNGKMPEGATTVQHFIQKGMSGATTIGTTATTIAFNTVEASSGTKLTASGNTIVVGSGVTLVRISYSLMSDSGGTATYLYSRIKKNTTEVSQQVDAAANQFRSTSETRLVPVVAGDVLSVVADSGANTLSVFRQSSFLVEVVV